MNIDSNDQAADNAAFEQRIAQALDMLKRWGEHHGYSGRLTIALRSIRLTHKKQATLTPLAPDIFTRSGTTYLKRPLSKDELHEIAAVNWNPDQRKIVAYQLLHCNQPLAAADIERILVPELEKGSDEFPSDVELGDLQLKASVARNGIWSTVNARLRQKGLPYRWACPNGSYLDQGPYRFFRIIPKEKG